MIGLVLVGPGMLLDPIGILLPVLEARNIDLIWFGVLMAKFPEIGFITPPVGLNVFVGKGIVGDAVPIHRILTGIAWFVVIDLALVALLIAFPAIVPWLPGAIRCR